MKKYIEPSVLIEEVMLINMIATSGDPNLNFEPEEETTDNEVKIVNLDSDTEF